ncbi:hypothetical protein ACFC1T_08755 [Kitasatospora sp. NPDC056076]|uniref:hypothetical protein n=1 Tax=Kitasatospora sp. NPDC056076 TaxID=3345703 RepID=UPI0035DAA6F9
MAAKWPRRVMSRQRRDELWSARRREAVTVEDEVTVAWNQLRAVLKDVPAGQVDQDLRQLVVQIDSLRLRVQTRPF